MAPALPLLPCRITALRALGAAIATAALLPSAAAAATLLCSVAGQDEPAALVGDPWGDAPVLQGAGEPLPVRRFVRGTTIIFDARRAVLYFDTGTRAFAYTQMDKGTMTTQRGTCEEGS